MLANNRIEDLTMEKIRQLLETLEYGNLHITVHDSQVTQIDKLEKHRIPLKPKQVGRIDGR